MDVTMQAASNARRTNATARELGGEEPGKFGFLLDQIRVAHQSIDGIDSFVGPTTGVDPGTRCVCRRILNERCQMKLTCSRIKA